jgi:rhodanese-related sulfurtransferase
MKAKEPTSSAREIAWAVLGQAIRIAVLSRNCPEQSTENSVPGAMSSSVLHKDMGIVLMAFSLLGTFAEEKGATSAPPFPGRPVIVDGGRYFVITPADLKSLLTRKNFFLVNTHVPYAGEIAGTDASIPFDRTRAQIGRYPTDKSARIIVYCRSGHMSGIAARELAKLGYTSVFDLGGGMNAWVQAGYPLENKR